jgi:hypothetical protein
MAKEYTDVTKETKCVEVMNPHKKRKLVVIWALVGCAVPVFWGVVSFIFFTAPESKWTDFYWYVVYITCPPWLLPETPYAWISWIDTPIANGLLYGAVAFAILTFRRQ